MVYISLIVLRLEFANFYCFLSAFKFEDPTKFLEPMDISMDYLRRIGENLACLRFLGMERLIGGSRYRNLIVRSWVLGQNASMGAGFGSSPASSLSKIICSDVTPCF